MVYRADRVVSGFADWRAQRVVVVFFSPHRGASQQPGNHFQLFTIAANVEIGGIAAGPDGNIWHTEPQRSRIGRIEPIGHITEFAVPRPASPYTIIAGPDHALWFADAGGPTLGRITT
jgi:streptogramin lyase